MTTKDDSLLRRTQHELDDPVSYTKSDIIAPILCSVALIICVLIANPFVNSAFNDDWSYSDTALRLAQTGRIHYNGWGSPTILFQSAWAALFIRTFGFSFNLLRIIAIPFSLGFVCLTYFLSRRLGLRPNFAAFATLTVTTSPLFIPLAASFMTEPYACFFTFVCIYASIAAVESRSTTAAARWLWILSIAGILGGADRQSIWPLPLLLLPYLAWSKRSNTRFLIHSAIAYTVCLSSLAFVLLHFHTGYAVSDMSWKQWLLVGYANLTLGIHYVLSILLITALMCLPALLCTLPLYRRIPRRTMAVILVFSIICFDYLRSGFGDLLGVAPFLGNILTPHGVLDELTGLGSRPKILRIYERYPITLFLLFTAAVWTYLLRTRFARPMFPAATARIFLIFIVPYLCLLLPGAILGFTYDRYALLLLPLGVICVLLPLQNSVPRIPRVSWIVLLVFAGYGIATTHDYARSLQARVTAVELAERKGVSRMQVAVGVESDGWTQLQATGKIDHMAYGLKLGLHNAFWFSDFTTVIRPDWLVYSSARARIPKGALVTVPFFTWLPPSYQAVSILKTADIPKHE
ncbi:MAG: phospholipid carrier-dependent glycosyltransferase [Bryobacteraceae bacterium]